MRKAIALMIFLAACGKAPVVEPAVKTLIDDTGQSIALRSTPTRVVSVAPSLTELVAAIGCESTLVGTTIHCDFPESVKEIPKCGSYVRPNIEAIVAMKPDLVLMVFEGPPRESVETLRSLGINVAVLKSGSVGDISKNLRWIGKALAVDERAESVAVDFEARYAKAKALFAGLPRPKTLYSIALDPVITAGHGSFIHQLIEDAGGNNIAGDLETPYPRMTLETVIERGPEVILFTSAEGAAEQQDFWNRWPSLPAVRNRRLLKVDASLINRPSPRIDSGLLHIGSLLHPEIAIQ